MSTTHPLPPSQRVLLLHGPRQPYHVTHDYAVPDLHHDREILVRTAVIGLNPIDWKAPDFNFAIPELPYIAGRECAGEVVRLRSDAAAGTSNGEADAESTEGTSSSNAPESVVGINVTDAPGTDAPLSNTTENVASGNIVDDTTDVTSETTPTLTPLQSDIASGNIITDDIPVVVSPEAAAIPLQSDATTGNIIIDDTSGATSESVKGAPDIVADASDISSVNTTENVASDTNVTDASGVTETTDSTHVDSTLDNVASVNATEIIASGNNTDTDASNVTPDSAQGTLVTPPGNDVASGNTTEDIAPSGNINIVVDDASGITTETAAAPAQNDDTASSAIVSRLSRVTTGDRVLAISTDYRDLRKGAYQEYVVVWDYNTVRLPPHLSYEAGATIGVAFVAAVLALGVNLGVDFRDVEDGPDLLSVVRQLPPDVLAADIRDECLSGVAEGDRARPGDWLAIWGASSTSAHMAIQLARLAGLRVAAVVDTAKHGWRLAHRDGGASWQPDLVVDSHDPARAVAVLRANLGAKLRFGFDTRGRDTATWLLQALACSDPTSTKGTASGSTTPQSSPPSPPATPRGDNGDAGVPIAPITQIAPLSASPPAPQSHLVGLTGLPKGTPPSGGVFHNVPIKLFHEVPAVGEALSAWLERLLASKKLVPPVVAGVEDGLERVNAGLDRLRAGEISGGRLVVRLEGQASTNTST